MNTEIYLLYAEKAREELRGYSGQEESNIEPLQKLAHLEQWVNPETGLHHYLFENYKELLLKGFWQRFVPFLEPPKLVLRDDGVYLGFLAPMGMDAYYKYRRINSKDLGRFIHTHEFMASIGPFSGGIDMAFGQNLPWVVDTLSGLSLPKTAGSFIRKIY